MNKRKNCKEVNRKGKRTEETKTIFFKNIKGQQEGEKQTQENKKPKINK